MVQFGPLVLAQIEFDDLVGTIGAQFSGDAEEHVMFAVFAVQQGGDGHDAAFVPQDGLYDAGHGGGDAEVGAALGRDDLIATGAGLLFDFGGGHGGETVLVVGQEAGEWLAAERDGGPCGELGVAVLAHHEAAHVARVKAGLFADDGLETRGVERGAGTEHLGARQTGTFPGIPSHHVDRVGDHDDHAVKTGGHDVVDHFAHKTHGEAEFGHAVGVGRRLAAHGDDDDVRILAVGVVAGAHLDVAVLEFAAIIEVAGLPRALAAEQSMSTSSLHRPCVTMPKAAVAPTRPVPTITTLLRFIVTMVMSFRNTR